MRTDTGFRLQVAGRPAPQGSKKQLAHGALVEMSKYVKPWRAEIVRAGIWARELGKIPELPLDGPLVVRMVFTLARPANPKFPRRPAVIPDLSKLCRATEDALSPSKDWAGAWTDDARVVEYARLAKVYPLDDPEALDVPGVLITVRPWAPPNDFADPGETHERTST